MYVLCAEIICTDQVTAPTDGQVTNGGNTLSVVRQFSCMEGYQLSGESYTRCQENGSWSTAKPVCTRKYPILRRIRLKIYRQNVGAAYTPMMKFPAINRVNL